MATQTDNYGLTKPAGNDNYDVAVQNGNMDLIDAALHEQQLSSEGKVSKTAPAAAGNLAALDASGNLSDSGTSPDSFAAAAHASTHAAGGEDELTPEDIGAATAYNGTLTLLAASWIGSAAPYTYAVPVEGMLEADYGKTEIVRTSDEAANKVLEDACSAANIRVFSSDGYLNFHARGTKPTVNIPIAYWGCR